MPSAEQRPFHLAGACPDGIGIVARIATFLSARGASITEANQHVDRKTDTFFMRYAFAIPDSSGIEDALRRDFGALARELGMDWTLRDPRRRRRVVILVSKLDHCLAYLLHRRNVGDLPFDLPCVISNHETLRELVEWYGVPFHHVPVPRDAQAREKAFEATAARIDDADPDTVVLARYMQIFPPWLCERYRHRVINIHHSFLPSFAGAKPYQQAEERGVKLTGATAHYATEKLDAGPIIEQDVVRVRHNHSLEDMVRLGKDVENTVLARALRHHLEDRVLVHGNKTILFA